MFGIAPILSEKTVIKTAKKAAMSSKGQLSVKVPVSDGLGLTWMFGSIMDRD